MINFDVLDNQFVSLSENELSDIDGVALPWLSLVQQFLGKLLLAEQHLQALAQQLVIFQEVSMIKDLDKYHEISNKELQEIKGGFGVGVGIALFMAAYTIGKDLRKKFG